jgi:hypothetical protein
MIENVPKRRILPINGAIDATLEAGRILDSWDIRELNWAGLMKPDFKIPHGSTDSFLLFHSNIKYQLHRTLIVVYHAIIAPAEDILVL